MKYTVNDAIFKPALDVYPPLPMEVKVKKLHPNAVMPHYASDGAAAFDLTAVSWRFDEEYDFVEYAIGLAFEIPKGYVGLVYPRSSISKTNLSLANSVGVIDSDYRGDILCRFKLIDPLNVVGVYEVGDRVAQMIIMPIPAVALREVDDLEETQRGTGAFGSTGA